MQPLSVSAMSARAAPSPSSARSGLPVCSRLLLMVPPRGGDRPTNAARSFAVGRRPQLAVRASGGDGPTRKSPFEDIGGVLKSLKKAKASQKPIAGADLTETMTVTFTEAVQGTEKQLAYKYQRECPGCKGKGLLNGTYIKCSQCETMGRVTMDRTANVKVPPGVKTGSVLRVKGEGNAGRYGGEPGNLYVRIQAPEGNATVKRKGNDLYSETVVTFPSKDADTSVTVVTIDGQEGQLKVPKDAKVGSTLRLRGRGVAVLGSKEGERGDHFFTIKNIKYEQN